jgi:hypothetical protein
MSTSFYQLGAGVVVAVHLAFVVFVLLGGLLVLRWPRMAWAHLPAAVWGAAIELAGWMCPLTPLEQHLRRQAGLAGYEGDFIARYCLAVLYPAGLTRAVQISLGMFAVLLNIGIYVFVLTRRRHRRLN